MDEAPVLPTEFNSTRVEMVDQSMPFRPRQKGDVLATKLTPDLLLQMEREIRNFISNEALTPPTNEYQFTVKFQLKGSANGQDLSLREYPQYWAELGRFAFLLGDVRTATICCDKLRPSDPLPADPLTLAIFYQYKSFDALTPCVDFNDNPVKYAKGPRAGEVVTGACLSWEENGKLKKKNGWSDPTNIRKCRVAIRTLHNSFCLEDMTDCYIGTCERCLEKNEDVTGTRTINWLTAINREFQSCGSCTYPRIRPRGCPTFHRLCVSMYNRVENTLKSTHHIRGALHMTTKQLRLVRAYLMSKSTDIANLQLWCLILMGVHLFLRAQEVCSIRLDQFRTECFVVLENELRVDQIVLWIKGKADKVEQSLSLFRDDENPEFCPVRALLVYLASANVPGPYLFPRADHLQNFLAGRPLPDDWGTQCFKYNDLLSQLKVRTVLRLHQPVSE